MKRVDIKDFAQMTGRSTRDILKMCKKGKLPCLHKKSKGKGVYLIEVESKEAFELLNKAKKLKKENNQKHKVKESKVDSLVPQALKEVQSVDSELINSLVKQVQETQQFFYDMQHDLLSFSGVAGQTKMLTISENMTKEQYYQLTQENKVLMEQKAYLKAELNLKNQQIEALTEKLNEYDNVKVKQLLRKI